MKQFSIFYYLKPKITTLPATVSHTTQTFPFGEEMAAQRAGGPFSTRYKFNGKELDKQTGYYYYGARYYDPVLSRWLSVDNLASHPNQLDKSPYEYAWNNPVAVDDPDGNCPWCLGAVVGAVIGGAVELTSQIISNAIQKKPIFKNIDWADVGIAAEEGAVIGATGGLVGATGKLATTVSRTAPFVSEALEATVDYKDGNLSYLGGKGMHYKDPLQVGADFVTGIIAQGAALRIGNKMGNAISGMYFKYSKHWNIPTDFIINAVSSRITNSLVDGTVRGLLYRNIINPWMVERNTLNVTLPTVYLNYRGKGNKSNEWILHPRKITPKGFEKIKKHLINLGLVIDE